MTLTSMTGFARSDGEHGSLTWHWEIRTVNAKGLDIRMRLPQGFEGIEQRVRDICRKRLTRGNCFVALAVNRDAGGTEIQLNETALMQAAAAVRRASEIIDAEPPRLDGLMSIKGVLEIREAEEDDDTRAAQVEAVIGDLEQSLDQVVAARRDEGQRLSEVINADLAEVTRLVQIVENAPARSAETIRTRLREQVERLLDANSALDEERLHQEAVMLAAKVDVQEEIERLKAHVAAGEDLLTSGEPVGRRLEFLMQEFNREANTICSKSNDTEISHAGLELKSVIDRLREQVQNIE